MKSHRALASLFLTITCMLAPIGDDATAALPNDHEGGPPAWGGDGPPTGNMSAGQIAKMNRVLDTGTPEGVCTGTGTANSTGVTVAVSFSVVMNVELAYGDSEDFLQGTPAWNQVRTRLRKYGVVYYAGGVLLNGTMYALRPFYVDDDSGVLMAQVYASLNATSAVGTLTFNASTTPALGTLVLGSQTWTLTLPGAHFIV